jgi:dCMP deaminase
VNQRGSDWWDNWFLGLAKYISTASKDPSTQVGCVIVGPDREIRATGYNGFPRGIADSEDRLNNRELKYSLVVHGEENALLYAARVGVSLKGCTAYVTWPPCTRCAVSMVQAGISDVFYPAEVEIPERWMKDFTLSQDTLREAGVRVTKVYQESTNSFPVQF